MDRPAPAVTAADWLADPHAAHDASWAVLAQLQEAAGVAPWWAWTLGVLGVIVPVARGFLPGIWGGIVDGLWRLLATRQARLVDAHAHAVRRAALPVADLLIEQPQLHGIIRDHVDAATWQRITAAIDELHRQQDAAR